MPRSNVPVANCFDQQGATISNSAQGIQYSTVSDSSLRALANESIELALKCLEVSNLCFDREQLPLRNFIHFPT